MKKAVSILLICIMLIGVIPMGVIGAGAITITYDIYVGGVGMANGTYLANGASATATKKPSGGYAYYKNGVLTLHDYEYSGLGLYTDEIHDVYSHIVAENNISIVLEGNNKLNNPSTSLVVGINGNAAVVFSESSGTLTLDGFHYGIFASACIDIGGNAITITDSTFCICAGHDITVSNSNVSITTNNSGMYAWENISIDDNSNVSIVSNDRGIQAIGNATVSGNVDIKADAYCIYSNEGSVTLGGTIDLEGQYGIGAAEKDIIIECDTLTFSNGGYGILTYGGDVILNSGTVNINAGYLGIKASLDITVNGGNINVTSNNTGIISELGNVSVNGGRLSVKSTAKSLDTLYMAIDAADFYFNSELTVKASEEPSGDLGQFSEADLAKYDWIVVENAEDTVIGDNTVGDVNGDGNSDNLDSAIILRYDARIIDLSDEQLLLGDVNGDGRADSLDAARILKYDVGLIEGF